MKRTLLALAFCCVAVGAMAEDTIGWHVVKPGDTLEGITARYLGSSRAWRENWHLNPDIKDPHKLLPGQRLRVIIARTIAAQSALIGRVSRRVEKKPEPAPWTPAQPGDRLVERNGVHTFAASSAELKFDDDTTLTLTEQSLVFLRPATPAAVRRDGNAIEIIDGHADLEKPALPKRARDFEIIVGGTVASANDAAARARFRNAGKSAQVMSYRGSTAVASAGATVKVESGMGVSVPDGQQPPAPEKLLGAPSIQAMDVFVPRPTLRWPALAGAKSYSVEICRDRGCAEMLARVASVVETTWRPAEALPAGALFWRVSGRSASGLDGYAAVAGLTVRRGLSGVVSTDDRPSAGVRVLLYGGDAPVAETRTDASGTFVFANAQPGDWSVVVDSRSISDHAWAEEVAPHAGGLHAGTSDDPSTLATSEHVTPATLGDSPVDGLDFAFSFNAVTHAGDTGQGSLRQFVTNANALPGENVMRFLGERAAIRLASPLPRLTDAIAIVGRGTAEEIGSVTRVGTDGVVLRNPSRSALSIDFGGAPVGLDAAAELTVRDVMLTGAKTHVRAATRLMMENVVIGTLLERRDAIAIEIAGQATLRRLLVTAMTGDAIVVGAGGTLDAEHMEISDSGVALRVAGPGSHVRQSLFLLNGTAIAAPSGLDVRESTFRGNRTRVETSGEDNEIEDTFAVQ